MTRSDGFWVPNERAAGRVVELRGPLDAIDAAYEASEFPCYVVTAPKRGCSNEQFMARLRGMFTGGTLLLPADYEIEFIAPDRSRLLELARWADDGGGV